MFANRLSKANSLLYALILIVTFLVPMVLSGVILRSLYDAIRSSLVLLPLWVYSLAVVNAAIYVALTRIFYLTVRRTEFEGVYDLHKLDYRIVLWSLSGQMYGICGQLLRLVFFPRAMVSAVLARALALQVGRNCLIEGTITDPLLVEIGENVVIGMRASIVSHTVEGKMLYIKRVRIGNDATIGAESVILPGVTVGNSVLLGAKSLVPKNRRLEDNTTYVGIPARKRDTHTSSHGSSPERARR